MELIYIALAFFFIFVFLKWWFAGSKTNLTRDLSGSVVIVTGSSAGIGKVTAKELLKNGATVVYACRSESKALKEIECFGNSSLIQRALFIKLDLGSFDSVINFVAEFKKRFNRLDILVNNAGLFNDNLKLTTDRIEEVFQTNHLSVTLLTSLLYDLLVKSNGRVVNVGSDAHRSADIKLLKSYEISFDNDDFTKVAQNFTMLGFNAYSFSKIGNNFLTQLMIRYADEHEHKITFACVHPGAVYTDITKVEQRPILLKILYYLVVFPLQLIFFKSEFRGAQTTLHCCYLPDSEIVKAPYYNQCKAYKEAEVALNSENMIKYMAFSYKILSNRTKLDFSEYIKFVSKLQN